MKLYNVILTCVVILLVAYIFKEDASSSHSPLLLVSEKCGKSDGTISVLAQQGNSLELSGNDQIDTSTSFFSFTSNDESPSQASDYENTEEAKAMEHDERIINVYNSDYTIYDEDELRDMGNNNNLRAQLELSLRISESRDKSLYQEGEYWARNAVVEAYYQSDKVLFAVAAEQMSTYAMLKGARVEDYAWIALGAKSGSAILKSRLEITKSIILNLTEYETKLAISIVPLLENMIKNETLRDNHF